MKSETMTLVLVNLAGIMERADESLLPGVYKEVGEALGADPTALGSLTLFRSAVQSLCYPLAAYLATRHDRTHVIALGAFLWALATFLVAISQTFFQVAVSRGLNGIGLAIVIPAIQSLVADSTSDHNRGVAFGWLGLTASLGSIFGGLASVLMARQTYLGVPGWRVAFHLIALLSVLVGLAVRLLAHDPRAHPNTKRKTSFAAELRAMAKEAREVMRVPSFRIIVAQGVSGSFPWSALSFAPMWLELLGFSHGRTAVIWTMFTIGCSAGGLFGGWMGDFLSVRMPDSGRIMMSQISSVSGIPIAAVLLLFLPADPPSAFAFSFVLLVMGLFISWNGSATNNPIFAEIVPERSRTSVYALDRCFETVLASFAPPVVGVLAQHVFGYRPAPKGSSEADRDNATALSKALYTAIGVPMAVCCFIYSFLYKTYPRDRDRARMDALIQSEMQGLEEDSDDDEDKNPTSMQFEGLGIESKERSETDVEFGREDEKYLISHGNFSL